MCIDRNVTLFLLVNHCVFDVLYYLCDIKMILI